MTTNEHTDEIQSRLNNIEVRFNNIDTRFNNLDSHLSNIENSLTPSQLNNPDTITQLRQQLGRIEDELKKAVRRDIQAAWLALAVVGAGFVGSSAKDLQIPWPGNLQAILVVSLGLIMATIGYCKVKNWSKRQK